MIMPLQCPLCGISATYPANLLKHLRGQAKYGGHNTIGEDALGLLAQAQGSPPPAALPSATTPPPAPILPDNYIEAALSRLVTSKRIST